MIAAITHGYPPAWNLGGEVSLHRTLQALVVRGLSCTALSAPSESYEFEGISVRPLNTPNGLDLKADPAPIARQLESLGATRVIAQNELSLPAVKAARLLGIPSVVNVHTPPLYGRGVREALQLADYVIYNTRASALEWGEPNGLVIHPPTGPLPPAPLTLPQGDAYTLLSSLSHKGVEVVLALARQMPRQRFIIVESPAKSMEPKNLRQRLRGQHNVTLYPRANPERVAETFFSQTRILLVPSRYETYGMSAVEAAAYGIPSVHVDTPHAREGVGPAAEFVPPREVEATAAAIATVELAYAERSAVARERAEFLDQRQTIELENWVQFVGSVALRPEEERLACNAERLRLAPGAFGA